MFSLLFLSPRQGEEITAAELNDVLEITGLDREHITHRILDSSTATIGDLDPFHGVLVGGSPLNMTTVAPCPWQQQVVTELTTLIDAPLPVFFLCFGTSLVASMTGGEVGLTHPEISGITQVHLTAAGASDPLFAELPSRFPAFTGHRENTIALHPDTTLLATGPTCPVQAFRHGESTWAAQFHPELSPRGMAARMEYYRHDGYFPAEEYEEIIAGLRTADVSSANQVLRNFITLCQDRAGLLAVR